MNRAEVRKAAEDLRDNGISNPFWASGALATVGNYILSTIRPDDEEPITAEWLISAGGKEYPCGVDFLMSTSDCGEYKTTLFINTISYALGQTTIEYHWRDNFQYGVVLPDTKTRHDFRRLAESLGVTLKEN